MKIPLNFCETSILSYFKVQFKIYFSGNIYINFMWRILQGQLCTCKLIMVSTKLLNSWHTSFKCCIFKAIKYNYNIRNYTKLTIFYLWGELTWDKVTAAASYETALQFWHNWRQIQTHFRYMVTLTHLLVWLGGSLRS